MKWIHPEAGEVEVNPQDAADEAALIGMGLKPAEETKPEVKRIRKIKEQAQ